MTIQYEFEELLNIQQAADLLSVHRATLKRWITKGRITPLRVGNNIRFRASDLDKWIKGEGK